MGEQVKTNKNLLRIFMHRFCAELEQIVALFNSYLIIGFGLSAGACDGLALIVVSCGDLNYLANWA